MPAPPGLLGGLPDEEAEKEGDIRGIDESDKDYLYPQSYFISYWADPLSP